jgi:hypothetical protein
MDPQHDDFAGWKFSHIGRLKGGRRTPRGWFERFSNDEQLAHAQNNLVRLFKDATTGRYEHPVVYIENGAHEFYPSAAWTFYGAPKHTGDGFHYLSEAPPNLGEIDNPLVETPSAQIILQYNGYWGAFSRFNDPPPGPPLHRNWTAVANSASEAALRQLRLGF